MSIRRILALSVCCGLGPTFLGCGERGGVDALPPGSEAAAFDGAEEGSAGSKVSRKSKRRALVGAPGPLSPPVP